MRSSASPLVSANSSPTRALALKLKSLGISTNGLDVIMQITKGRTRVAAGADVIRAGDTIKRSTLLFAGMACSYKRTEDGGRNILSFHHAGDFCDLHRFIVPERDIATGVQALTDCSIGFIDYRDMDQVLARPELALAFWRATMLEAANYRERLTSARRGSALERVAHLLCEQLVRREAVGINSARLPISQIDIADATALSVVHVNRTIQSLRSRNALSKSTRLIEVTDRKRLMQVAKFDGRYLDMPRRLSRWAIQLDEPPA